MYLGTVLNNSTFARIRNEFELFILLAKMTLFKVVKLTNTKMIRTSFLLGIMLLITYSVFSQSDKNFNVYWSEGLKAESPDGKVKIKLGGRIQTDVMFINQDDSLNNHFDAENGVEFRRARIYTSGTIYKNIKFKFQMDFAGGNAVIKDAYVQLTKIPGIGNLRVGNFKEPSGLAMLTSSKYITFMERPLGNAFDNDRNIGGMIFNQHFDRRFSWYAGYFYPTDNSGKYTGNKYNLVFRIAGLPYYNIDKGYKVLHLGVSMAHQYQDNSEIKYSIRPEAHLAPKYLSMKVDEVKDVRDINGELLFIFNSFALQGGYTYATVNTGPTSVLTNSSYHFYGYNGSLSWFVTGEHKNYVKSKTVFDKIKPKKNLGDGGVGAIELAIRYSEANLDDADLNGGKISDITGAINWYLNPATKVAANYIYSDVKNLGKANIFQMRFQIVF